MEGRSSQIAPLAGAAAWLALVLLRPPSAFDLGWSYALLLLAPLVLVPLALRRIHSPEITGTAGRTCTFFQFPAALLLAWSFLMPQGNIAALISLPWLASTGLLAVVGLRGAWRRRRGPVADLCLDVALVYLAVGAFWVTLDRWGQRPLDFESVIVLLTGIHFHYAGFVLPVLAALAMRVSPTKLPALATLAAIAAVPLTALGIMATQLGHGPLLESLAAWFMSASGLLIASLYCRLGWQQAMPLPARVAFMTAGLSLLLGMVLAAMYGTRFYLSLPWLDIPWMRALHGSLNALGFSLAGILGWQLHSSIK